MTSVPYPSFKTVNPVDVSSQRAALTAVGRCRIHPEHYDDTEEKYRAIVTKCTEQARVDLTFDDQLSSDDEKKQLKKKYMKEAVVLASTYLRNQLQLDCSVIDVEVFVSSDDVIRTDGCLASCLLDAGCSKIVMDGMDVTALDAAKIPADRLMAHFEDYETTDLLVKEVANVTPFCDSVSVHVHDSDDISEHKLISLINSVTGTAGLNVVVQFRPADCRGLLNADLASMVGIVCREDCCTPAGGGKNNPAATTVSLVDPTAAQLGLSYAACLKTDRTDGLYTTVVCTRTGEALGLVYSSKESIVAALQCGRGVYYSRSRKSLWRKGDTSGHYQTLHRLDVDCDGDALRFTVTQQSTEEDSHRGAAFCHLNTLTCWGPPRGLRHLEQTLQSRLQSAPEGSYTKRLFDDSVLLRDKLVEEAQELAEAVEKQHVAEELADVLYFAMVRATAAGVSIDDAVAELDRRTRKVTRRKGDSKAFRIAAARDILNKTDD